MHLINTDLNNWPWQQVVDPSIYDEAADWPKISIITPTYNQGGYIEETILSLLSQNYPNLEYIIMDAGSTDATVEIIKKYNDKIAYWESKKDRGQSHALNKGLAIATGDIIGYLNSDDCLFENALYQVAKLYQANKQLNNGELILVGDCLLGTSLHSADNTLFSHNCENWTIYNIAEGYGVAPQPATFWTKCDFHFNEDLEFAMDYDYWYKLVKAGFKPIRVPHILSYYRIHESSKSVNLRQKMWIELSALAMKWVNDFPKPVDKTKQMKAFNYKMKYYYLSILNDDTAGWKKLQTIRFMLFLLFNYPPVFFNLSFFKLFLKKLIKA